MAMKTMLAVLAVSTFTTAVAVVSAQPCPVETAPELILNNGEVTLRNVYNEADDTVTFQITYAGTAWLAFGINSDGFMIGSHVVVGVPGNDPQVERWSLGGKSAAQVTRSTVGTELRDVSFVQENDESILTFTQPLEDTGIQAVSATEGNHFIYAFGRTNEFPQSHASNARDGTGETPSLGLLQLFTCPQDGGGEVPPPPGGGGGTAPPTDEGTVPPTDEGTVPPTDEGTVPPTDEGTAPPTDGGDDGGTPPTPPENEPPTPPEEPEEYKYNSVCYTGYVSDSFCINQGRFLDIDLDPLLFPWNHTAMCLLDPEDCRTTMEILGEPAADGEPYTRQVRLDPRGIDMMTTRGYAVGEGCTNCTGTQEQGLQATAIGFPRSDADPETGLPPTLVTAAILDPEIDCSTVGETPNFCVSGYLMDTQCIQQGYYFDDRDANPLREPETHTAHCLLDVASCQDGYEILGEPCNGEYPRVVQLDDVGDGLALAHGRHVGSCETCDPPGPGGETKQTEGIQATVFGVLDTEPGTGSDDPPLLRVTRVVRYDAMACAAFYAETGNTDPLAGAVCEEGGGDGGGDDSGAATTVTSTAVILASLGMLVIAL